MKNLLLSTSFLLLCLLTYGQTLEEKQYFETHKDLGGDVIIKKSYVKIDGEYAYRIFEVEALEAGDYYLNSWTMVPRTKDGYKEFLINVNEQKENKSFISEKAGWQSIKMKSNTKSPEKVKLIKGTNTIAIGTTLPDIPEIEFIRLSKEINKVEISNQKYDEFITKVKADMVTRSKMSLIKKDSTETMLKSYSLDNPSGNYHHVMDVNYNYTYNTSFYFTAGQKVSFGYSLAIPYVPYDPVIELFNENNPETGGSWVAYTSVLNATIGNTGNYRLRLRPFVQNTSGVVDLYKDGLLYMENCPVSGAIIGYSHGTTTTYNYFTANITQDTKLWLEDGNTLPGRIRGYNDDYYGGGGDFSWGLASRIKKDFSVPTIRGIHITAYSSNAPTGTCDVYIQCMNSSTMSFPNLKADDAIQSAASTNAYNCASWGGGCDDLGRYFWASNSPDGNNQSSDWYEEYDFWGSWENYFGNKKGDISKPRFTGAPTYIFSGSDETNAEIAMWYNPNYYGTGMGDFTHFSVVKPANNQPHGYAWESKPGGNIRTFHPKNALNSNAKGGYGEIKYYWKRENASLKSYTLEQSVALGLTVLPMVNLNNSEKNQISTLKNQVPTADLIAYEKRFNALIEKSLSPEYLNQSNPGLLYRTQEYKDLIEYSKAKGKVIWPILFEKAFELTDNGSGELAGIIVNQITPEYKELMVQVKEEADKNCYTPEGAYIAPSPIANTKNYIKKLIFVLENEISKKSLIAIQPTFLENSNEFFSVYPNPFKESTNIRFFVNEESLATIKIYSLNGSLLNIILDNQKIEKGEQIIKLNAYGYKPGLYMINLTIGGKTYSRRFLIEN